MTMIRILLLAFFLFSSGTSSAEEINSTKQQWLNSSLYGSDNEAAALRKVTIRETNVGYKINIENQFNFECELGFNEKGNPSTLSNCSSNNQPEPICDPDKPDSPCAVSTGCFKTKNENNPSCFRQWIVKEPQINLICFTTKNEQVCKGKYTLATTHGYSSPTEFTIARKIK